MVALSADYMAMLKKELTDRYVPMLSPLLPNARPLQEQQDKQVARALSAFVLRHYLDVAPQTAANAVIDDFNDNGIDAIYYHQSTETLYLVQSKLKPSEEFAQAEAQAFCAGCRLLIRQEFDTFNDHFQQRKVEIEESLGACSTIRLLVAYCGPSVSHHAETTIEQLIGDDSLDEERLSAPIEYFTPPNFTSALRGLHAYQRVNATINLKNYGKVEEPRKTYFGLIHMQELVELHQNHGKALYEQNIRYFLGSNKSDVNKSIQNTLKEEPANFFYLNNGVTALCDKIDPKNGTKASKKFKLLNLSIINGAQTVASAAELMQSDDPPDISKAKVLLTLIQSTSAGEFSPKVTRARNHQNPVSTANFASLDPQQERLRQELACFGINYHYRPEALVIPSDSNILLAEAITALAYLEPDPRYTVWLKASPAAINDAASAHYQTIFSDSLRGVRLVNAVLFTRHIHRLLKAADAGSSGVERLVYRHGLHAIGAVLVKRLRSRIDMAHPFNAADIGQLLSRPFDELRQQAADLFQSWGAGCGPLAHFKSQERTVPFVNALMTINYGCSGHPAIAPLNIARSTDAFPLARLFNFLSQQAPQI